MHKQLIVALDVQTTDKAEQIVDTLGDSVDFYKVGLELFLAKDSEEFIREKLIKQNKQLFIDLKFFDIPRTVHKAVSQLKRFKPTFISVHGNDEILKAAIEANTNSKILSVTALTSLDQKDIDDLGFQTDIRDLVLSRARRSIELGCDGIVSSGLEAKLIREEFKQACIIVTPGIRPVHNDAEEDQKRIVTPEEAFNNGADYIVVGRPIIEHPSPRSVVREYFTTCAQPEI